jgi:hypothetical protein
MGLRNSLPLPANKEQSSRHPLTLWRSKSIGKSQSTLSYVTYETTGYSPLPPMEDIRPQEVDDIDNTSLLELNPMQSEEDIVQEILATQTEDAVVAIFSSAHFTSSVEEDAAWLIGWEVSCVIEKC